MTWASFPFHSQIKEEFSYHKAIVHMVEKIGFLYNNRELKVVKIYEDCCTKSNTRKCYH